MAVKREALTLRRLKALLDVTSVVRGEKDLASVLSTIVRTVAEGLTEEWRAVFDTNVLGTLAACRAALRHMLPRGAGDIVNVTSASAHEAWPYLGPYSGSKAAVHTLSRALRAEVAGHGIRVMTVEVHNVATEFGTNFDPEVLPDALRRWKELGLLKGALV